MNSSMRYPEKQGLYDPNLEHDSCGVGFIVDMHNRASHDIIRQGLELIGNLEHRGALGADPETGDGCGILIQIPHAFLLKSVLLPDSVFQQQENMELERYSSLRIRITVSIVVQL